MGTVTVTGPTAACCALRYCGPAIFPNGNVAKSVASFYEVYGKVAYTWTDWVFGANFYYSPNFLNTGADGEYLSGTIKFTAPEKMALGPFGWYVSGEFGRQWLGTSDAFYGCILRPPLIGRQAPASRTIRMASPMRTTTPGTSALV